MMAFPPFRLPALPPIPGEALLRPCARAAARLCLAALLLAAAGTTGLLWFGREVQGLRPAAQERLHGAAAAAAGEVQDLVARVARTLDGVRPEDALAADRIALAGRLLRLEPRLQPAAGLFVYGARGGFVAGSAPLPPGAEDVSAQPWFRAGMVGPANEVRLAGPAIDPLGRQGGVLLLRRLDRGGVPVGLVGTFLKAETAWALLHQTWSLPPARLVLLGRDGLPVGMPDTLEPSVAGAAPLPPGTSSGTLLGALPGTPAAARTWLRGAYARVGADTVLTEDQPLGGWTLRATADLLDLVTPAEWVRAGVKGGLATLAVLLGGTLPALVRIRRRRGMAAERAAGPMRPQAADGTAKGPVAPAAAAPSLPGTPMLDADWIWELDSRGRLVGVAGNAPAHLIQAIGCPLVEAAGPQAEQDRNWTAFRVAARNGDVITGLDLPFAFPGAAADQIVRVRFAGKPVRDTGGYWGAALQIDTPKDPPRAAYAPPADPLPAAA